MSGRNRRSCVWQHEQKCGLASRGFIFALNEKSGGRDSCTALGRRQGPGLFELIALPSFICGFHPYSYKMLQHLSADRKKGKYRKEYPPIFFFFQSAEQ